MSDILYSLCMFIKVDFVLNYFWKIIATFHTRESGN